MIELSRGEAEKLVEATIKTPAGTRPYLVRALCYNEAIGGYDVHQSGTNLWVQHESLGSRTFPQSRRALVVLSRQRPVEVYVTAAIAE